MLRFQHTKSKVLIYSWQNPTCIENSEEIKGRADAGIPQAARGAGGAAGDELC